MAAGWRRMAASPRRACDSRRRERCQSSNRTDQQMTKYRIAVIAGDGIGREVVPAGIDVLTAVARPHGFALEFVGFPWGCDYYLEAGRMMPPDALDQLRVFDAIYLGAIGAPSVPDHVSVWELILP